MKTIAPIAALFILVACTTSPEKQQASALEYQKKAEELFSKDASTAELKLAVNYLDSALAINPKLKGAYTAKTEVLRRLNDEEALYNNLIQADKEIPGQTTIILNLGLEYESRGDSLLAQKAYTQAASILMSTLDTLQNPSRTVRNSYASNLAMALILSNSDPRNNTQVKTVMEIPDNRGFSEMINSVASMPRSEVVNISRGMIKPAA